MRAIVPRMGPGGRSLANWFREIRARAQAQAQALATGVGAASCREMDGSNPSTARAHAQAPALALDVGPTSCREIAGIDPSTPHVHARDQRSGTQSLATRLQLATRLPLATRLLLATLPLILLLSACSDADTAGAGGAPTLESVTDTIGDTVVVRTLGGSLQGEGMLVTEVEVGEMEGPPELTFGRIQALAVDAEDRVYVLDGQGPALRVYSGEGEHIRTVGRPGSGPGEYRQPDSGLLVLPDGRILLRDPGNQRISVYSPEGEPLDTWLIRGGFNTSRPLYLDRQGRIWYMLLMDPTAQVGDWRMGFVRFDSAGSALDTVPAPRSPVEEAMLEARREGSVSRNRVPFTPSFVWSLSPEGGWITGLSDRYRIEVERPDGTRLRLEKSGENVAIDPGERQAAEARVSRNMRVTQPDWRWNGPPIPDHKPAFREVFAGADGRIWVGLHGPGRLVEDERPDPQGEGTIPPVWSEPWLFDVFEPDGAYLGRVHAPEGFTTFPSPVIHRDRVWAVLQDDLGVQRVARMRLEWGQTADAAR